MGKFDIAVYAGKNVNGGGCGCGCMGCGATSENVQDEYQHMVDMLQRQFADSELSFTYIDTEKNDSLSVYPTIEQVIMNGYSFPVTVINETPYLAGALDYMAVTDIINDLRQSSAV
jgi:disulfide oxidoreductase YuzD